MFNNILVAVDGSACAAHALDIALELAKQPGTKLSILHAIDPTSAALAEIQPGRSLGTDPLHDNGKELLAKAAAKAAAAGIDASTEMVMGKAVEEVVDVAKRLQADLIVIGSHGRKGLDRMLAGSVAEGVLREVTAPTLVVHAP